MDNFITQSIQKFAQQIAEAISSVLGVDISIIGSNMVRIAGTGIYLSDINNKLPQSFAINKVIKTAQKCLIMDPGNSEFCKECIERAICKEKDKFLMLVPVLVDNAVMAGIELVTPRNGGKYIVDNHIKYSNFMEKMADLLAAKIKSEIKEREILSLVSKLNTITEAYPEGIMSIDAYGKVTHFNRSAEILLSINSDSIINKRYTDRIACTSIEQTLLTGIPLDSLYSTFTVDGKQIPVILTIHPMKINQSIDGLIVFFQEADKAKKVYESFPWINRKYTFDNVLGTSPSIVRIKTLAKKIAQSESTILLSGESGTGKEVFARAIHSASKRSNNPFIAINCSAIPESLLESELFGYEEGSFTGAKKGGKPGKFELAEKGTIFLDEIGDMPLNLQPKLLRVLQERVVERVGGTKLIPIDVRLIAATNKNLMELIKNNRFREDLYYRINVIPINLPPLRDRKEDIILLARHFLNKYNTLLSKNIEGFDDYAASLLLEYSWPGNVRELENAIEYAVNIETSSNITVTSLPSQLLTSCPVPQNSVFHSVDLLDKPLKNIAYEYEKEQIKKLLHLYGSSTTGKKKVAEALGMSLSTFYRKLKALHLDSKESRKSAIVSTTK